MQYYDRQKDTLCVSWMWNVIWLSNYNLTLLEVLLKRKDSYVCVCFPHTTKWQIYFRPRPPTEEYLNPHFSAACLSLCVLSHAPALHTGHTHIQDKQECLHVIRPYLIISRLTLLPGPAGGGENKGGIKKKKQEENIPGPRIWGRIRAAEEVCVQCWLLKMFLWVALLMSHCCLSLNAADEGSTAGLSRIEHCGTRCSQVKPHPEEHYNQTVWNVTSHCHWVTKHICTLLFTHFLLLMILILQLRLTLLLHTIIILLQLQLLLLIFNTMLTWQGFWGNNCK